MSGSDLSLIPLKTCTIGFALRVLMRNSELDVLMLGSVFPPYCSVSAKKQLKWFPFLGWFSKYSFGASLQGFL